MDFYENKLSPSPFHESSLKNIVQKENNVFETDSLLRRRFCPIMHCRVQIFFLHDNV